MPARLVLKCPDGGIGRRAGLKHQFLHRSAGSTPALGTLQTLNVNRWGFLFFIPLVVNYFIGSRSAR